MRFVARSLIPLALVSLAALAIAGCGGPRTYRMNGTARDPGAEARVQVENIDGGNHLLTLTVRFLTPPDRLGDGNQFFMMWIQPNGGTPALASQLGYTPDTREARATATTPHNHFTLIVTAERDANAARPSDFVIFRQEIGL